MKKSLGMLCIILLASNISVYAQQETLYVIHVKGQVFNASTHKKVAIGDALKPTDKISFYPDKASVVVMSTQRGRFALGKTAQITPSASGEFIAFVKNTLIPVTSVGNLSTRETPDVACIEDLKKVLGSDAFVFPDDKAVFCLDKTVYPMNANNFFIYRPHTGSKEVNYMIPFSGDSLFIEKDKFYAPSTVPTASKADIYYFNKAQNSSSKITTITPLYVQADELKSELSFLVQLYKKQKLSKADIVTHLAEHVESVYGGRTDKHMLERWVQAKGILRP